MGLFKKLFKGVKKIVKKIGKGIKKVVKGFTKAFGKLGVVGQLGLMFIPGVGQILSGMLGTVGRGAASFMSNTFGAIGSAAVDGFKAIMGGFKAASSGMGKVFSSITDAVVGGVDWITKTASGGKYATFGDAFDGFKSWVQDTGNKIFNTDKSVTPAKTKDLWVDIPKIEGKASDIFKEGTLVLKSLDERLMSNLSEGKASDIFKEGTLELKSLDERLNDQLIGNVVPTGLEDYDVEKFTKNANNVFDNLVSNNTMSASVVKGVEKGLEEKTKELIVGKRPTPKYITNSFPNFFNEGNINSDVVSQADFALQSKGGLYGSTNAQYLEFGQDFNKYYTPNDSTYNKVLNSLTPVKSNWGTPR